MGSFTKKELTEDEKQEYQHIADLLSQEYEDICKLFNDLGDDVSKLKKLNTTRTRNVINATVNIEKRMKEFRDSLRQFRAGFTVSKHPLINSPKKNEADENEGIF